MASYTKDIEQKMRWLFGTLSEKDRRRYAAIEAAKLGHGGLDYVCGLFELDPKTVRRGLTELALGEDAALDRVRKKGGGCKPLSERQAQLETNFLALLAQFTAGDPMREGVLWTNLSVREISRRLAEMGTLASRGVVRQLLRKHRLGQRNFSREGHTHTQTTVQTLDHDFPSAGDGKLIPHGIYDLARNEGYVHLNTSHDTSEFCCDSIAHWWRQHGCRHYPHTERLLILCDGGGSNATNRYVFKEALQALADRLGREIRVAHYPPYCSKHNPIEHRLFPHITRACQGVVFHTVAIARQCMERAKTSAGLKVTVDILQGVYATGKKCAENFRETMGIIFDDHLPRWNYRASPQAG